jgi:hypothetical protein
MEIIKTQKTDTCNLKTFILKKNNLVFCLKSCMHHEYYEQQRQNEVPDSFSEKENKNGDPISSLFLDNESVSPFFIIEL